MLTAAFPSSGLATAYASAHSRAAGESVTGGGDDGLDPVTLGEAKAHLRVSHAEDDTYITALVTAAREAIEDEYGLACLTQTVTATYRGPAAALEAPVGPVQSVTTVDRADDTGTGADAWLTADLTVLGRRIAVSDGERIGQGADTVTLVYPAGYGDDPADVPARLRQAILLWVADLYEYRTTFDAGSLAVAAFPGGVQAMLHGFRRVTP